VDWDGPAAGTTRPVVDNLTHVVNKEAPALSARCPDGSVTPGKRNAVAQAGPRNGVKSDDKDRQRELPEVSQWEGQRPPSRGLVSGQEG
jgi:hypothetical protein